MYYFMCSGTHATGGLKKDNFSFICNTHAFFDTVEQRTSLMIQNCIQDESDMKPCRYAYENSRRVIKMQRNNMRFPCTAPHKDFIGFFLQPPAELTTKQRMQHNIVLSTWNVVVKAEYPANKEHKSSNNKISRSIVSYITLTVIPNQIIQSMELHGPLSGEKQEIFFRKKKKNHS